MSGERQTLRKNQMLDEEVLMDEELYQGGRFQNNLKKDIKYKQIAGKKTKQNSRTHSRESSGRSVSTHRNLQKFQSLNNPKYSSSQKMSATINANKLVINLHNDSNQLQAYPVNIVQTTKNSLSNNKKFDLNSNFNLTQPLNSDQA